MLTFCVAMLTFAVILAVLDVWVERQARPRERVIPTRYAPSSLDRCLPESMRPAATKHTERRVVSTDSTASDMVIIDGSYPIPDRPPHAGAPKLDT